MMQEALHLDATDPVKSRRDQFCVPVGTDGKPVAYFVGNSLGLAPRTAKERITEEVTKWERHAVEGHFEGFPNWFGYHESVTESLARLAGAMPGEVVAMNSLTTNLHLMLLSFYRPTKARHCILMEEGAFSSDRYAAISQAALYGFGVDSVIECAHSSDEFVRILQERGSEIACVLLGNPNFTSGYVFDVEKISAAAHQAGAVFGLDLAHGMGNLVLKLHEWQVDFAVWCSYKYLNSGPGAIAGAFVHEKHHKRSTTRAEGWWGHNKETRFRFPKAFDPIHGVEAWQLSNPPILQLAALRSSLAIFDEVGIAALRARSVRMTRFLEEKISSIKEAQLSQITPREAERRGCQLSFRVVGVTCQELEKRLRTHNVLCDFREPDIMRVSPAPLYNTYEDVARFVSALELSLG